MSRVVLHPQRLAHDVEGVERVDHLRNRTALLGPSRTPAGATRVYNASGAATCGPGARVARHRGRR